MKKQNITVTGLLLDVRKRASGSMTDENGREVTWDDADILTLLPYGATKGQLQKYTIHPKCAKDIYGKTADVNWGAYVELELDNNQITDINVINDPFVENIPL